MYRGAYETTPVIFKLDLGRPWIEFPYSEPLVNGDTCQLVCQYWRNPDSVESTFFPAGGSIPSGILRKGLTLLCILLDICRILD